MELQNIDCFVVYRILLKECLFRGIMWYNYANYLMGRAVLCAEVVELKQHPVAITAECI